jgi:hypothetical protein
MKQIRRNVFETNSSSTHSITMCSQSQFEDWKNGKILFDDWNKEFVKAKELTTADKEDAKNEYKRLYEVQSYYKKWEDLSEDEVNKWYGKYYSENCNYDNDDLMTYSDYFNSYDLESYTSSYTSESGDKIIAFGKYGYDG